MKTSRKPLSEMTKEKRFAEGKKIGRRILWGLIIRPFTRNEIQVQKNPKQQG